MKRNLIYHAHIPFGNLATVKARDSIALITELEVIAKDGITLACNRQTLDQLLPNKVDVVPKGSGSIEVSFSLETNGDTVEARCNVIAVRRLARDTFQVVLRFKDISEHYSDSIDRYIDDTIRSRVRPHRLSPSSRSSTLEKVA